MPERLARCLYAITCLLSYFVPHSKNSQSPKGSGKDGADDDEDIAERMSSDDALLFPIVSISGIAFQRRLTLFRSLPGLW
jgi:hypothetical protein